ncbi:hypothetical protein Rhe02_41060 [Rhizocola hellebori]|uniref:Radical SAM core domain-containing protein n=1 Tax=Rhizocola hellebori TaxID=1392758 RepID=A0A8J3VG71_9ACTN|nr:FxsB family cyclophane-forming radical SAM/SPASM peptide maturase [Rhizocola hellebori]GIH06039.1 hypothetical protein Rhe02_41060 [Rhizocola hellebori]
MSQFVLKVHSRCDLACDHCYVYEHEDQSWRERPRVMTPAVIAQAAARIAEHAAASGLSTVHVVLHGGEPLLMGLAALGSAIGELRATIEPVAELDLRMQSNGVLLNEELCDLFAMHGVKVGISLDGGRMANDRHRRFPNGASSYGPVLAALQLLRRPEYRASFAGLLCTIDIANDPIEVYEALIAQRPPRIDLLLPHATWERPPPRPDDDPTPYATWLGTIYRRWVQDGKPVPIRMFDSLQSLARGGASGSEALGLDAADVIVIETDGAWEQADSMKTAYHGAPETGYDIFTHTAAQAALHPAIVARFGGLAALCDTCQACPVVAQCGGGLYAHRYRSESKFDNPSVYCADLKGLITIVGKGSPAQATAGSEAADSMPADLLDRMATGYGDAEAVQYLADTQLAFVRALLVAVAADATGSAAEAWKLLGRLEHEAPQAVKTVLTHPYVRAWAVHCLENEGADRDRLACLVAAAAIHGNVAVQVTVPVHDGAIHLPTLGTVRTVTPASGDAVLSVLAGGFTVRSGRSLLAIATDVPTEIWEPAWRVDFDGLRLVVEDSDPYRDCHEWTPGPRLTEAAAKLWTDSAMGAWQDIRRHVPEQVPGMRIGLAAITPLVDSQEGVNRAATSRHAFGALGTTSVGPRDLAVVLVHEFQHSKMGATLDLFDLLDPGYPKRLAVGWRKDPRPAEGVLQGIYAHLGVADIWRARAIAAPDPEAVSYFNIYRDWTTGAIDTLTASGALTQIGQRFVTRMGEVIAQWPMVKC